MANSLIGKDNLIGKITSLIDKLFKGMGRLLEGYDVKDGNVEEKAGQVTVHLELTDGLSIDLSATNIVNVFNETVRTIDSLSRNTLQYSETRKILDNLLGEGHIKYDDTKQLYILDKPEIEDGEGMLGVDVSNMATFTETNKGLDLWSNEALDYLRYTLNIEADGYDHGEVTNQTLLDCVNWIFRYYDMIRGKETEDTQLISDKEKAAKLNNAYEVALKLVRPILATIQKQLIQKYINKINSETTLSSSQNNDEEPQESAEDQNPSDETSPEENTEDTSGNPTENNEQESGGNVTTSKQIKIKLKKIEGSIDLIGLESNYEPAATLADIDDIVNQDEFIDALSDEVETYTVNVDEDGYDIEQCETCEIDPCQSLNSVMNTAIIMYRNLYILHWMAKGNDMMKLHLLTEELYSELIQEIDTLGELLVEKCGTVQNLDFEWTPIAVRNYEFQESLFILKDFIQNYIDTIDYAYPNQTSDVQSTLDEWLRYWNKQMNYFIKNQEEP